MSSVPLAAPKRRLPGSMQLANFVQRQGVLCALALLIVFGALRYDNFLSTYNVWSVLRFNSMFGLIALGMTFVIMTGGIDLSVGAVAAFASVIAALLSPYGLVPAVGGALLGGTVLGLINGFVIARLKLLPFVATLAMLLGARGLALVFAGNHSVSVDPASGFVADFGQGELLGVPIPVIILVAAYGSGWVVLGYTQYGRHVLAVGGNEEASRLMGLRVERLLITAYTVNGLLAALAGVLLAAQFGAGQPTEGVGWELSAIASVVVGGTLLTGGLGSVAATLVGVLLLGLILNILNFENGRGFISLSAYWQSVIRGAFLLVVVVLQNRLAQRR